MKLLIIAIIIALGYIGYNKYMKKEYPEIYLSDKTLDSPPLKELAKEEPEYMPYAKGSLLTKTEHTFFVALVREALKRRLLVCPKVRLEDIIFVTDWQNRFKYRGYIKSRHVDFVLINPRGETACAIELDDPSHYSAKAAQADEFKNKLFYTVKIPLIRIFVGSDYIKEINAAFDALQFPKAETPQKNNSAS